MVEKKMPAKSGEDYIRGEDWQPLKKTKAGWLLYAKRRMPTYLKRVKFTPVVSEHKDYFRINYGAK